MNDIILEVTDLKTEFASEEGRVRALDGVSFYLREGKTLGIVGESGCGKSVTSLSIMRLLPKPAGKVVGGSVIFRGEDLLKIPARDMHKVRGRKIAMIFQEPMTALNPVHRIGKQIGETMQMHFPHLSSREILRATIELLVRVGIPSPELRVQDYPHQLSGGMRQRVMIAIALACKPDILITDEPTTALDVTIQAQILELIQSLQEEMGMSVIMITHDLGVIAEVSDEVVVMYAGKVVEQARVEDIFNDPKHPYTKGLLASIPRLENKRKSRLKTIEGTVPPLHEMPMGCRFQNRCTLKKPICEQKSPSLCPTENSNHLAACHLIEKGGA